MHLPNRKELDTSAFERPVDLIAWYKEQIIFFVIRRTQNEGITKFTEVVVSLAEMVKTGIPGKIHFWLYRFGLWHRYQIMPGGAFPLEWGGA